MRGFRQNIGWMIGWAVLLLSTAQAWATPRSNPSSPQAQQRLVAQAFTPVLVETARSIPGGIESTRVKMLAALARGDISAAIVAYEADTGKEAPEWLTALQAAYSATNQVAGNCQNVARTLYTAYQRLGQEPRYIAFQARGQVDYITFDLLNGKNAPVTRTGYHVAVAIGDTIRDAYTGPLGMKLSEYLSRLQTTSIVDWRIVTSP